MEAYEIRHLSEIRRHLAECTVLLRKSGAFPLKEACRIAAFGSGVRRTVKGGTGSGDVNSRFFMTVERGLERRGFEIVTRDWLDAYDEIVEEAREDFIRGIKKRARQKHTLAIMEGMGAVMPEPEYDLPLECSSETDTAIYVLARNSGEGSDRQLIRGDILLTETEIRDIRALNERFPRFMLVLNTGGPVDLTPVADVKDILLLSQLGVETGSVLAWILLGAAAPSGKLTTTWPAADRMCPFGTFGDQDDTRYSEGIYVGYRYFDTVGETPLFPFGYGLSYTDFEVRFEQTRVENGTVTVVCGVRNTGSRIGREVVQLYVSKPAGRLDQPFKELIGYGKTRRLAPGSRQRLRISFPLERLASYDTASASWILEPGAYVLRMGTSSADTQVISVLRNEDLLTVSKVRNALGEPDFEDLKPLEAPETAARAAAVAESRAEVPADTPVILIDPAQIILQDYTGEVREDVDPQVRSLPDEELAYLAVGEFDPKAGPTSVIGNAAQKVAGAAGETTERLQYRGLDSLVLADGPAGLRLSREYTLDRQGYAHGIGSAMPAGFEEFLPRPVSLFMHLTARTPGADEDVYAQYCTAIPIGTAVAQAWDPEAAACFGDIVGREMEIFGVDLWLAPALNIHRDIRCGRNFEYYSEDPLVSGLTAAAITAGVQKHPGRGVTIKHFCANNQETDRFHSNSIVSERALREIYLKGFEICVREARPMAVMTSYNLLNGTHTSERRDLTTDILRGEWGFKGIVMTDCVIASMLNKKAVHPMASVVPTLQAGGDLFMPGSAADWKAVTEALKDGTLTREVLEKGGSRLVRLIRRIRTEQEMAQV